MDLKELKSKNVLILGAGKTGIASASFLLGKCLSVSLSESNKSPDLFKNEIESLEKKGLKTEFGKNSDEFINSSDLVIISPGISPSTDIVQKLTLLKKPIISDIELASYFINKPIIAVTGTNGKTTVTSLITHLINNSGKKAISCGNIGKPLIEAVHEDVDYFILEISSYQIYYSPTLSPYIAVLTNITPDHLDWHGGFENYVLAKKQLFAQQKENSWSILNYLDPIAKNISVKSKSFYFSSSNLNLSNESYFTFFDGECLRDNHLGSIIKKSELRILGLHNIENVLASIAVASILGIDKEKIVSGLKSFEGVEHRIEFVKEVRGKSFYNDSKATNPEATVKAIQAFGVDKKITLILGGRDKNTDLSKMIDSIKKYVSEVILFGEAKERFQKEIEKKSYDKLKIVKDLNEAINNSLKSKTDIVLFSPACASFDMFKDYEERGKFFKELVGKL